VVILSCNYTLQSVNEMKNEDFCTIVTSATH